MASESKEPDAADLLMRFFGIDPTAWLEDVYNIQDDLVNDGVDATERELLRIARTMEAVRGKPARVAALGSDAAGTETDLQSEIVQGADKLASVILDAHETPGDKFFLFAMRNVFVIPSDIAGDVEEAMAQRPQASRTYSAKEEEEVDSRVQKLEASILAERRRRRALNHVRALFERRVPAAEEAAAALQEAARVLFDGTGTGGAGADPASLAAFTSRAARLRDLCSRLSSSTAGSSARPAPPAAAAAAPHLPLGASSSASSRMGAGAAGGSAGASVSSLVGSGTATGQLGGGGSGSVGAGLGKELSARLVAAPVGALDESALDPSVLEVLDRYELDKHSLVSAPAGSALGDKLQAGAGPDARAPPAGSSA